MSIYPTLTDLCGIATPKHVEGPSIRTLLADPQAAWDRPAMTTYGFKNHASAAEGWRYIRYANGDEELYDETSDPYEWKNLAARPEFAASIAELARFLPRDDISDISRDGKKQADKEMTVRNPAKKRAKKRAAAERDDG